MTDYRGESYSLRARIRELEAETESLEREGRLGPTAPTRAARGAYAAGQWLRRKAKRLFDSRDDVSELERLRRRVQLLERRVDSATAEPMEGFRAPDKPREHDDAYFEAGRRVGGAVKSAIRWVTPWSDD